GRGGALQHQRLGGGLAAEMGGFLGFLLAVGIVDDDLATALGQDGSSRRTQSRSRPRHDREQPILGHPFPLVVLRALFRMVRKSGYRFSDKTMRKEYAGIPYRAAKSGQIRNSARWNKTCHAGIFRLRKWPCSRRLSGLWLFLIIKRKTRPHLGKRHSFRGRQSTFGERRGGE